MAQRKFILTGAPGAGKTTVIDWIKQNHIVTTRDEPAREIIAEQRNINGSGLWERDTKLFLQLLLSRSIAKWTTREDEKLVLYDRGIPDCIGYAMQADLNLPEAVEAAKFYRYETTVFVLTPWEEMYQNDSERTLDFESTMLFHSKLVEGYKEQNYKTVCVPQGSIEERGAFIMSYISGEN